MCWPVGTADRRYAGVTNIDCSNLGPPDVSRVNELIERWGVSISGLGYYPNPLSPDLIEAEAAIGHLHNVIRAAEMLGIGLINTFVGRDWTRTVDANWSRLLEVWRPMVKFAEDHGVRIGIENCPMLFSDDEWPGGKNLAVSPRIWRRMFDDIPSSNFGLNYDPSHLVWQQMDYIKPIREFADRLFHAHAKDTRVDHERLDQVGILAKPTDYFTPKLPGLGDIDWGQFCSALYDINYRGAVCVEVEDRSFERDDDSRKSSLRLSRDYLRKFVAQ